VLLHGAISATGTSFASLAEVAAKPRRPPVPGLVTCFQAVPFQRSIGEFRGCIQVNARS
jgi:hypothetical protein